MSIAELLLDQGLITAEQLAEATALRKEKGLRLDRALIKLGYIEEEVLHKLVSEQLGIPLMDLSGISIDAETLRCLPAKLVYRKRLVPVSRENGTLTVATADPYDLYAFDEIRLLTNMDIRPVLASEEQINQAIKTHYGVGGSTIDEMAGDELQVLSEVDEDNQDLAEMAQEASVIKLVNEIFIEALNERASDIHIEPYENELVIRYRIDGVLQQAPVPPQIQRFQLAIISRIKILSNLNIAEKRVPQDGRIKLKMGGREVDIRVSVIPMLFGEGVVMRVLDKSQVLFTLPQLGMPEDTFAVFEQEIARPHGIILVTGPTGSGKTTTLYAALQAILGTELKIITVEDPVEYHIQGINQIQVAPKVGLTFAAGLRAILRHDPDVVMIGEIRDTETAQAAIQAALTGHLVLSTLHTNDACSAATRLMDMGIEPFLVSSTLNAAMAQRLVRSICKECKEEYEPNRDELPPDFELAPGAKLYRGAGCRACRGTGYRGRKGLYELMAVNHEMREQMMHRVSSQTLVEVGRRNGLRLLREDGWLKVREGLTTVEEVIRSTNV